ncbi:MAG: nitrilase, partial [Cytophagales bacterium]|nr:nitrilase [Cytophagales bacterium]
VGVSQTILDAPWSPAVDINFGYAAFYSSPDSGLPTTGVLRKGKKQQPGWILQKLDFEKNSFIQNQGQVFNSKDMTALEMSIGMDVNVLKVTI